MREIWAKRSIRFWVVISLALAIGPLSISAVVGYFTLKHGVLDSFKDVASRQHNQIKVLHELQLSVWEGAVHVDHFLADSDAAEAQTYRGVRQQIESLFARLHGQLGSEPEAQTLLERARTDWTAADRLAAELISSRRAPVVASESEPIDRFESLIESTNDRLGAIGDELDVELNSDYSSALLAYERSEWIAALAATVSVMLIVFGVWLVGRVLLNSISRLVDGVERFRSGDRDFRVEIAIPPELTEVADEFNKMIVQIRRSESALIDLAIHDKLTGLLNRHAFDQEIADARSRMLRSGEPFSLLILDLDRFKQINDTYGHAVGDDVLRQASREMTSCLRDFDKVFRLGGEEFAILLPGIAATDAGVVAERIRCAIAAARIRADDQEIKVTASIGIAQSSADSEIATVIKAADAAMYQAKREGRNRVVLAPS